MRTDSQEQDQDKVLYLINKLRDITLTVQVIPFVYTIIYIIILLFYHIIPTWLVDVVDAVFYISPLVIIILLTESRILKLCKWHKFAICIPIVPQISVIIDDFFELTQTEYFISIITVITMSVLLLIAAYNIFFK